MTLFGKVALVTGGSRGIGRAIVLTLAKAGADVAINYAGNTAAAEETAEAVKAMGRKAIVLKGDVADTAVCEDMIKQAVAELGRLDILVNNAGINRDAMLHKMTVEQWDQVIAVNLTGTFYCVQYAAQIMREKGSGAIINISSASWLGNIGQANYAASKAGVVGLTKTACRELARKGVTCNAICPGFIDTDMTRGVPEKVWDTMISKIPMGRAGSPADVANMVAFLASDEANYITGEVINVGGGMIL